MVVLGGRGEICEDCRFVERGKKVINYIRVAITTVPYEFVGKFVSDCSVV